MDSITAALPPNPKQAYGDKKPSLGLVPSAGVIYEALAFEAGAVKYGPYNWREKGVEAMTYVNAALRHLYSWLDGERNDPETGGHHLGHARACMGILLDCMETGNLIDNRPKAGCAGPLLDELKPTKAALVEKLKAAGFGTAGFGTAEEPYPEGCEPCKGQRWDCHKEWHTGEHCGHECEYPITAAEYAAVSTDAKIEAECAELDARWEAEGANRLRERDEARKRKGKEEGKLLLAYSDGYEAGTADAMKAAGRGDERLSKFCAIHKRWLEVYDVCPECQTIAGSSR